MIQQVSQVLGRMHIIDCDHIEFRIRRQDFEGRPSDPSQTIEGNFHQPLPPLISISPVSRSGSGRSRLVHRLPPFLLQFAVRPIECFRKLTDPFMLELPCHTAQIDALFR